MDFSEIVRMVKDLEVEEMHLMASRPHRLRHPFESERLQTEINFGIHQATGMYQEDLHGVLLLSGELIARDR
jgi:hypothetical protein